MSNRTLEQFRAERTTVWDFPIRGDWATHKGDYRGNFAPQIARNVILNYSTEGDLILDPMVGSGTTLIEARLLNRRAVGLDINPNAVAITEERLNFPVENTSKQRVRVGDVRDLSVCKDDTIDLILTHPPYANIVKYSDGKNPDDLSSIPNIHAFLDQLELGIRECYRVLKPDHYCAILIGDTRKGQHYVPLSHFVLDRCLKVGLPSKKKSSKPSTTPPTPPAGPALPTAIVSTSSCTSTSTSSASPALTKTLPASATASSAKNAPPTAHANAKRPKSLSPSNPHHHP